jgi:hypothetical protein
MTRIRGRHRVASCWPHLESERDREMVPVAELLDRNARHLVTEDRSLWHYLVPLWRQRTGVSRRAVMIPRPRTATD